MALVLISANCRCCATKKTLRGTVANKNKRIAISIPLGVLRTLGGGDLDSGVGGVSSTFSSGFSAVCLIKVSTTSVFADGASSLVGAGSGIAVGVVIGGGGDNGAAASSVLLGWSTLVAAVFHTGVGGGSSGGGLTTGGRSVGGELGAGVELGVGGAAGAGLSVGAEIGVGSAGVDPSCFAASSICFWAASRISAIKI